MAESGVRVLFQRTWCRLQKREKHLAILLASLPSIIDIQQGSRLESPVLAGSSSLGFASLGRGATAVRSESRLMGKLGVRGKPESQSTGGMAFLAFQHQGFEGIFFTLHTANGARQKVVPTESHFSVVGLVSVPMAFGGGFSSSVAHDCSANFWDFRG